MVSHFAGGELDVLLGRHSGFSVVYVYHSDLIFFRHDAPDLPV